MKIIFTLSAFLFISFNSYAIDCDKILKDAAKSYNYFYPKAKDAASELLKAQLEALNKINRFYSNSDKEMVKSYLKTYNETTKYMETAKGDYLLKLKETLSIHQNWANKYIYAPLKRASEIYSDHECPSSLGIFNAEFYEDYQSAKYFVDHNISLRFEENAHPLKVYSDSFSGNKNGSACSASISFSTKMLFFSTPKMVLKVLSSQYYNLKPYVYACAVRVIEGNVEVRTCTVLDLVEGKLLGADLITSMKLPFVIPETAVHGQRPAFYTYSTLNEYLEAIKRYNFPACIGH